MRLLTPLCLILLTIAFCPRATYAQDSPIYVNDNGNVPFQTEGQKGKTKTKTTARPNSTRAAPWSFFETHIDYEYGQGIQNKNKEFYIEEPGSKSKAVCLEYPNRSKILLATGAPWTLKTKSDKDQATLSSDGTANTHIHIDPGATMGYNPPYHMDDPDPDNVAFGKKNQMKAAVFNGGQPVPLPRNHSFIIHYCGPSGCDDESGVDQCAGAKPYSKK
jgi:hypothetical protein